MLPVAQRAAASLFWLLGAYRHSFLQTRRFVFQAAEKVSHRRIQARLQTIVFTSERQSYMIGASQNSAYKIIKNYRQAGSNPKTLN